MARQVLNILNGFHFVLNQPPIVALQNPIVPHGGWRTFNQFFARDFKPGLRPVAAVYDPSVIVSPADSTFAGQWEIRRLSA